MVQSKGDGERNERVRVSENRTHTSSKCTYTRKDQKSEEGRKKQIKKNRREANGHGNCCVASGCDKKHPKNSFSLSSAIVVLQSFCAHVPLENGRKMRFILCCVNCPFIVCKTSLCAMCLYIDFYTFS